MRFLSSIFSFNTLDLTGFHIPRATLIALLLLAVCEIALHVYADHLPAPVLWGEGQTPVKIAQAQEIARNRQVPIDILIVGPSHAASGISPTDMQSDTSNLSIYNGALNGRTYSVMEFVFREVYWPLLQPKLVVVAVSPIVLNVHNAWMERNTAAFFTAPMPKALVATGFNKFWQDILVNHVYLYRYHQRDAGLKYGCRAGKCLIDQTGFQSLRGTFDEEERRKLRSSTHPYQSIMRHYDFGGPSAEKFLALLKFVQQKARLVVINMPFRQELLEISPTGKADYQRYFLTMRELQSQLGFVWYDYQADLPFSDSDFRDVDHLNSSGARKLSHRLAKDLKKLLHTPMSAKQEFN